MGILISLLPSVLGPLFQALFGILFSGETVRTVSETKGIDGLDVEGGSKPQLTADDLPAF